MSLFSKLFGNDKEAEKAAKDLFTSIFGNNENQPQNTEKPKEEQPAQPSNEPAPSAHASGPSGFSWGETMPNEPNQYNYNGSYWAYFEEIFRTEFPEYRVEIKDAYGDRKRILYTFYDGARKALVVELMGRSCSAKKTRSDCRLQGIPYLRYYYDYDGWWNTRAYVIQRTRGALSR